MTKSKFYNHSGLSMYAMGCGYVQSVALLNPTGHTDVVLNLHADGACFHIRVTSADAGRLEWISENNLTDARDQWKRLLNEYFGAMLRAVKEDKRYSIARIDDLYGAPWIARYDGELITHAGGTVGSSTKEAAWMLCYSHMRGYRNAPA